MEPEKTAPSAAEKARSAAEKAEETLQTLKRVFDAADENNDEALQPAELAMALQSYYKIAERIARPRQLIRSELVGLMGEFDTDGSGTLQFPEFCQMVFSRDMFGVHMKRLDEETRQQVLIQLQASEGLRGGGGVLSVCDVEACQEKEADATVQASQASKQATVAAMTDGTAEKDEAQAKLLIITATSNGTASRDDPRDGSQEAEAEAVAVKAAEDLVKLYLHEEAATQCLQGLIEGGQDRRMVQSKYNTAAAVVQNFLRGQEGRAASRLLVRQDAAERLQAALRAQEERVRVEQWADETHASSAGMVQGMVRGRHCRAVAGEVRVHAAGVVQAILRGLPSTM